MPTRARSWMITAASVAALSCASGCLDNKLEDTAVAKQSYIAQQRDFADYLDWMAFPRDVTEEHGGVVGTTTIYVKELPPEGEHEFPVGALLVKTMKPVDTSTLTIHAMAKRGSGFNAKGASGWEFFEMLPTKTGTPAILWRGEEPPSGEIYLSLLTAKMATTAATTEQKCNDCHGNGTDGMLGDDIVELIKQP
jgi:hypothetical protein